MSDPRAQHTRSEDHGVAEIGRSRETEYMERVLARGFVVAGGLFWVLAAFSGPFVYEGSGLRESLQMAMWPLLATLATLIIGWRYERLAAFLLLVAASAVLVWGVLYQWELGIWVIMSVVLIAPMLLASTMFTLAARAEDRNAPAEKPTPLAAGPLDATRRAHPDARTY
jgi:hypothetical protein